MQPPPPVSRGKPRSRVPDSARHAVLPLVPGAEPRPGKRRPLPDAAAVRLLIVPDSAPPYDDAFPGAGEGSQGIGQASQPYAPKEGSRGGRPENSQPRRPEEGGDGSPEDDHQDRAANGHQARAANGHQARPEDDHQGRQDRPDRGLSVAAGWPSRFAQVLAETLAGSRPQGQITPWTTEQARRRIRQLGPMLSAGTAPRVRRVVTSVPAPGVVEMTVIVSIGPAIRALAVRLERDPPRHTGLGRAGRDAEWVCTAIEAA